MQSVVCTLFEGHYHFGLAGLVNSLHANGFKGEIYAGYRGNLPPWANASTKGNLLDNLNSFTLNVNDRININFIELDTQYHLTNFKAQFILSIWNGPANKADNIFYFDPDIINKCNWQFYEKWVSFGVALVHEIVWNDMLYNHPKRMLWNQIAIALNIQIKNKVSSYINAGFIGLNKSHKEFIEMLYSFIIFSSKHYHLDITKFSQSNNDFSLFKVADQDLLNLTAMCTNCPLSEMGPEAMDFINGGWTMSHAAGGKFKPWKKKFLAEALRANPPSKAEKEYWNYANGIIRTQSEGMVKYKKFTIRLASFIGRFYRKY